jgi:cysteine desulfurase
MKRIYLDYNATTPVHPHVVKEIEKCNRLFGNPSSVHKFGQEAKKLLEEARERIAKFINAESDEIIFTSCGSESTNLAIKGIAYGNKEKGNHIITSSIEHHAVLNPCEYLEKNGFSVTYIPVDKYGLVDPNDVKKAIRKDTILISIMHANNEIGTIQPIEEIGKIAKENQIYFHTDAIQTFGKIKIDVNKLHIDLLSFSGHKFYAPKGIGGLYVRRGIKIEPLIHGGHHEKNRRAGTENVPSIVGMAKACEIAEKEMEKEEERLRRLTTKLWEKIESKIDDVIFNGHPEKRLANTLNVSFKFVEGEAVLISLDLKGVAVSTGSACASGSLDPSHVLLAIGLSYEDARGAIRFSLGKYTTNEDIDYVGNILPKIISKLRTISPLKK